MNTHQPGFFDEAGRLDKLSNPGDPLVDLKKHMDFGQFRPMLEDTFSREKKSPAGRPPLDPVFMFKILILQRLYNIPDGQVEHQINGRRSFQRFPGLHLGSAVPDYTSVRRFREQLTVSGAAKKLFDAHVKTLEEQGAIAKRGMIVDASFAEAPRQHNSREENEMIKEGKVPPDWGKRPRKPSQKDTDARRAQKNGRNYYGCKDHDVADAAGKLPRDYEVTPASVHDSRVDLINEKHAGESLFADSAYKSRERDGRLATLGINNYIHEQAARNRALDGTQKKINRIKSGIRARIGRICGHMENSMGGAGLEYMGLARIKTAVGLRNLAHNFARYVQMIRLGQIAPGEGWRKATA